MLTLKSPFVEFITLCEKDGACPEAMEWMNKQLSSNKEQTFGDAILVYVKDEKVPEGWSSWNIEKHGDQLDSDIRDYFISCVKDPMESLQLLIKADCTIAEQTILKARYEGKLPTAEKELRDGVISIKTATAVAP